MKAYLECQVLERDDKLHESVVRITLFDKSTHSLKVRNHTLEVKNGGSWLVVDSTGTKTKCSSVVLPSPILNLGTKVTVASRRLKYEV